MNCITDCSGIEYDGPCKGSRQMKPKELKLKFENLEEKERFLRALLSNESVTIGTDSNGFSKVVFSSNKTTRLTKNH